MDSGRGPRGCHLLGCHLLGRRGPGPTPTLRTGRAGLLTLLVLQQGQGHGHILGASDQGSADRRAGHTDESRDENWEGKKGKGGVTSCKGTRRSPKSGPLNASSPTHPPFGALPCRTHQVPPQRPQDVQQKEKPQELRGRRRQAHAWGSRGPLHKPAPALEAGTHCTRRLCPRRPAAAILSNQPELWQPPIGRGPGGAAGGDWVECSREPAPNPGPQHPDPAHGPCAFKSRSRKSWSLRPV